MTRPITHPSDDREPDERDADDRDGTDRRCHAGRRRRRRAAPAGTVVLVACALAAAACGDDDGGASLSATSTTTVPERPEETLASDQAPLADIALRATQVAEAAAPTSLVTRPDSSTLYVAEREGRVVPMTVRGSGADATYTVGDPILDISDDVVADVERGLLDIEFSPDGGTLYVSYSLAPDGDTQIDAYTMDGDQLDTSSARPIFAIDQPFANHNGGDIEFGPDGFLYVMLGDGGDAGDPDERAQNTDDLLGKILRIDPASPSGDRAYGIPADNPFADGSGGRPEIWLYGVRNPWRIAFDSETDDLWVADVGQDQWEEIDFLPAADGGGKGANLGWDDMEGSHTFEADEPVDGTVLPVYEYSHDEGCSITGGVVYRGDAIPALDGAYLFGDYCNGGLQAVRVVDGALSEQQVFDGVSVANLVSFGTDPDGEVYALSLDGGIYRIDAA